VAQDHQHSTLYTVRINRAISSDATLESLAALPGTLRPLFSSTQTMYKVLVGNEVERMRFAPIVSHPMATVTVNGGAIDSGFASNAVPLVEGGATTITVAVTAADGAHHTNYIIEAIRKVSDDATLSSLVVSYGTLSPSFSSLETAYHATVPADVDSVTVTPSLTRSSAFVRVEGREVVSGQASLPISLAEGDEHTVDVVVTAEDTMTVKTYRVGLSRAPKSNARLQDLQLLMSYDGKKWERLLYDFDSNKEAYSISVANAVREVRLVPEAAELPIGIFINGQAVASRQRGPAVALKEGSTTSMDVLVKGQDGSERRYRYDVERYSKEQTTIPHVGLPGLGVHHPVKSVAGSADEHVSILPLSHDTVTPALIAETAGSYMQGFASSLGFGGPQDRGSAAASATRRAPTQGLAEQYECQPREAGKWGPAQAAWCCQHHEVGCKLPSTGDKDGSEDSLWSASWIVPLAVSMCLCVICFYTFYGLRVASNQHPKPPQQRRSEFTVGRRLGGDSPGVEDQLLCAYGGRTGVVRDEIGPVRNFCDLFRKRNDRGAVVSPRMDSPSIPNQVSPSLHSPSEALCSPAMSPLAVIASSPPDNPSPGDEKDTAHLGVISHLGPGHM